MAEASGPPLDVMGLPCSWDRGGGWRRSRRAPRLGSGRGVRRTPGAAATRAARTGPPAPVGADGPTNRTVTIEPVWAREGSRRVVGILPAARAAAAPGAAEGAACGRRAQLFQTRRVNMVVATPRPGRVGGRVQGLQTDSTRVDVRAAIDKPAARTLPKGPKDRKQVFQRVLWRLGVRQHRRGPPRVLTGSCPCAVERAQPAGSPPPTKCGPCQGPEEECQGPLR